MEHTTQEPKSPAKVGTDDEQNGIALDDVFSVLSNSRRRHILEELDRDPELTLATLAEQLAAIENDCAREELTSEQRKRLYISLYQTHLPALDDAGVIDLSERREIEVHRSVVAAFVRVIEFTSAQQIENDGERGNGVFEKLLTGGSR
ncbi:ArsR family transcriptional regulator [Halobellus sp. Atlit-31R]|nr:ArsR family transcriptional regulator [Halobellus sp. Atlit-31R]